jgi:hypothetical protein
LAVKKPDFSGGNGTKPQRGRAGNVLGLAESGTAEPGGQNYGTLAPAKAVGGS